MLNPFIQVSGRGIRHLEEASIPCTVGVAAIEAAASLRSYLYQRNTGLPWVVAKIGTSLDGKIAAADGTSQWITNAESRKHAHQSCRAKSQAVIVGWRTVDADDPQLTVREFPEGSVLAAYQQPTRVVLGSSDGTWRPAEGMQILDTKVAPTIICTPEKTTDLSLPDGIETLRLPTLQDGRLDFHALLVELGKRGMLQVLVEGGASLMSSLLKEGIVNQLVVYTAPIVLGSTAKAWSQVPVHETMPARSGGDDWKLEKVDTFGDDICATYVSKKALAKAKPASTNGTST
ncbi:diaminohydroxyphosphoribosylaminopyrimidine deaminase / 5-amino-6-(5-phosphoribosylamino)uracil reductase [Aphelenchoides avenae]|nr:diaminohydroxyphosphoribosylaminopyrimidine deaminase / 5-amino-6-(5-phosphoribosylamino)uracil reductase [Aphelenchus avenae]